MQGHRPGGASLSQGYTFIPTLYLIVLLRIIFNRPGRGTYLAGILSQVFLPIMTAFCLPRNEISYTIYLCISLVDINMVIFTFFLHICCDSCEILHFRSMHVRNNNCCETLTNVNSSKLKHETVILYNQP